MSSFGVAIPLLLFFLEAVQDEHRFLELHGIDRAVGATCVVLDDFQDAGTAEALEHFRRIVPVAVLGEVQGMPEELAHAGRKRHQVLLAAPDPDERFFLFGHRHSIPEQI